MDKNATKNNTEFESKAAWKVPPLSHPKRRIFYHQATPPLEHYGPRPLANGFTYNLPQNSSSSPTVWSDSDNDEYDNCPKNGNHRYSTIFNSSKIKCKFEKAPSTNDQAFKAFCVEIRNKKPMTMMITSSSSKTQDNNIGSGLGTTLNYDCDPSMIDGLKSLLTFKPGLTSSQLAGNVEERETSHMTSSPYFHNGTLANHDHQFQQKSRDVTHHTTIPLDDLVAYSKVLTRHIINLCSEKNKNENNSSSSSPSNTSPLMKRRLIETKRQLILMIEEYRKLSRLILNRCLDQIKNNNDVIIDEQQREQRVQDIVDVYNKSRTILRTSVKKLTENSVNLDGADFYKLRLIVHDTVDNLYKFMIKNVSAIHQRGITTSSYDEKDYDYVKHSNLAPNNLSTEDFILIKFYSPQIADQVDHLNAIIDQLLEIFKLKSSNHHFQSDSNKTENRYKPISLYYGAMKQQLIVQSRFLVLAAHKLLYVADIFHQCCSSKSSFSNHDSPLTSLKDILRDHFGQQLAVHLKIYVKSVKSMDDDKPDLASSEKILAEIVQISSLINDFKCFVSSFIPF